MVTRLVIHGRVQGVFYRDWTVETAHALGLAGWVRNLPDGTVEAMVEGDGADVEQFIRRCHEGPERARVDHIHRSEADGAGLPRPFERRS
ncbi:acylphosphatase [Sphingomonas quercus]|uniref:acylphosphatase n=1 Tax=Sphingomonas quercus TaxID=2842451 RepID=A0ABS6BMR5_9SPHN|nr:acylphosphatase [Sphingomonas quercus]MBU3079137.1 acylphosphatase [Sphingomonas quercus]